MTYQRMRSSRHFAYWLRAVSEEMQPTVNDFRLKYPGFVYLTPKSKYTKKIRWKIKSTLTAFSNDMSGFTEPAVGHRADAPTYRFLDNLAYIVVTGDQTDGRRSVVEMHQPEGHKTPMHIHEETDETLHVLEGAITTYMEDTTRQVTAGGTVVLPRGEKHALVADEPSVVLVSNTPAGFDEFVTAAGEPTEDETVPTPPPSEEAIQRVRDVAPEHGIEIVGPPPGHQ